MIREYIWRRKYGRCDDNFPGKQYRVPKMLAMPSSGANAVRDKPLGVLAPFPARYILRLTVVTEEVVLHCGWRQLDEVLCTLVNTQPAPVALLVVYNGYTLIIGY